MDTQIESNIRFVQDRIAEAAAACGRSARMQAAKGICAAHGLAGGNVADAAGVADAATVFVGLRVGEGGAAVLERVRKVVGVAAASVDSRAATAV